MKGGDVAMTEKTTIRKLSAAERGQVKDARARRDAATYQSVQPAQQLGFIHNNVARIGRRACDIACNDKNGLAPGQTPMGQVRNMAHPELTHSSIVFIAHPQVTVNNS